MTNADKFKQAIDAGYTADEIVKHLSSTDEKLKQAIDSGYTPDEIVSHFTAPKERSFAAKTGRIATQAALGSLTSIPIVMAHDAVQLASRVPGGQYMRARQGIMEDLEWLAEKKKSVGLTESEEAQFNEFSDVIAQPARESSYSKTEPYAQSEDYSTIGLIEKGTGLDLKPEGYLEKAAFFLGGNKTPSKWGKTAVDLKNIGLKPSELVQALKPGMKELRSLTGAAGWELAERGGYGPIGIIAASILGHMVPGGIAGVTKAFLNPKQSLARAVNYITRDNSNTAWQKQLIISAREAGLQLDAGSLTDSRIIKLAQAKASQSGLTGDALDKFRQNLSGQIIKEYEQIAESLSTAKFENAHQASESVKSYLETEPIAFKTADLEKGMATAPPLRGRVGVFEHPQHRETLLNAISPVETITPAQGGQELRAVANDIRKPIKDGFTNRWNEMNQKVSSVPSGPQVELARQIRAFVDSHGGTLLPGMSSAESQVMKAAQDLSEVLSPSGSGYSDVSLSSLIKTKQTLADIADFDFGGSNFKSAYKTLVGDVDTAIKRTLLQNPELRVEYLALNAEYSAYKQTFENKHTLKLFERNNNDVASTYSYYLQNPDRQRALEGVLGQSEQGIQLLQKGKRDYASRVLSKSNMSDQELRELGEVLGNQNSVAYEQFAHDYQYEQSRPGAQPIPQKSLPFAPQAQTSVSRPINAKESVAHAKNKSYDMLKNESPEKLMARMNTQQGIKKTRHSLSIDEEGKKLFNELARLKLDEMIRKNLTTSMTDQVKLGTFSNLLKSAESQAVVKELVGPEAYARLRNLQGLSAKLSDSADMFFNASKSGATVADIAIISYGINGAIAALQGNPFMLAQTFGLVAGMRISARLLADPVFLKFLEEAILINPTGPRLNRALTQMGPHVLRAVDAQAAPATQILR